MKLFHEQLEHLLSAKEITSNKVRSFEFTVLPSYTKDTQPTDARMKAIEEVPFFDI
jgi:hypothetical protein